MSTDGVDQAVKIEELREAVLKMESQAPVKADGESTKIEAPKPKKEEPLPPDLPEEVKRTQKLIGQIHERREERARLVAEGNSKSVRFERETRVDEKNLEALIDALERELDLKVAKLKAEHQDKVNQRNAGITAINSSIARIDVALDQMKKQLDAELGKMGAKVSAP